MGVQFNKTHLVVGTLLRRKQKERERRGKEKKQEKKKNIKHTHPHTHEEMKKHIHSSSHTNNKSYITFRYRLRIERHWRWQDPQTGVSWWALIKPVLHQAQLRIMAHKQFYQRREQTWGMGNVRVKINLCDEYFLGKYLTSLHTTTFCIWRIIYIMIFCFHLGVSLPSM